MCLLESYLDFFYAKEIVLRLSDVIKQKCGGCALDSLSQRDHTCLSLTKRQQLSLYFEDILKIIDEEAILSTWREHVITLNDISQAYSSMYELKLNCKDWRETMKTQTWKYRLIKLAAQLMCLKRCF